MEKMTVQVYVEKKDTLITENFLYHKKTKLRGSFPLSRVNIKFTKILKLGGHSLAINLTLYTYMQTHTYKGGNQI